MTDLPTVITTAGLQPQLPASLLNQLIALVTSTNPGYTADLPGSLIEDVSSTEVAGISLIDQSRVEAVNSLTPYGANAFTLNQLGQIYGVPLGAATNTSVNVVFTGPLGVVISPGFIVSDGTYQYTIVDGGIIGEGGVTAPLFALATISGSWDVQPGTVNVISSQLPPNIQPGQLTVTNPQAGTPGVGAETEQAYRSSVLQAGLAASQGMTRYLKTLVNNVSGVQSRLVSVLQQAAEDGGGWEIIVGGGDPFQVANAIFQSLFDVSTLVGSVLNVIGVTQANPGVVTTDKNHGYTTGQVVMFEGIDGMTELNGNSYTATVITETTFSIGVNTTAYTAYTEGGVVTPNLRNTQVSISDYPDTYVIPFVIPPQQTVTMVLTWNTSSVNFVSQAALQQLAIPALVDYINQIAVGQPINVYIIQSTFQSAVASVLPANLITVIDVEVAINGITVDPTEGTGIIAGDPESYFLTDETKITVTQA